MYRTETLGKKVHDCIIRCSKALFCYEKVRDLTPSIELHSICPEFQEVFAKTCVDFFSSGVLQHFGYVRYSMRARQEAIFFNNQVVIIHGSLAFLRCTALYGIFQLKSFKLTSLRVFFVGPSHATFLNP